MISVMLLVTQLVVPGAANAQGTGWQGDYFNNRYLSGTPAFTREAGLVNFDWGNGSPDWRLPADGFSARWTRTLYFDGGRYRFLTETDDGTRLYLDGVRIVDKWQDQP